VLCFTSAGGFYYHLAALETAHRCHIPVVIIVNNKSGFSQNLTGVHRIAGDRADRGEALIRFGPTDFTAVARSFGVRGIRVEQPGAIAANGPVVVDVVTALEPRAPEPWAPPR
jgi:acetolactate synthase-1/2/3 large subunit